MTSRRLIPDEERRARLVRRHHLGRTATDVTSAVRDIVAFHSSDPVTPHLAAWARVPDYGTEHLDHAIAEDRSLWRLHAMRRTLFVVAKEDVSVVEAAAGRDIARKERRRFEKWLDGEIGRDNPDAWMDRVRDRVLEMLSDGAPWRTQDLKEAIPALQTEITLGSGKWARRSPVASRVLFLLAMEGSVVRTMPAGSWRSSQYAWASADEWFDDEPRRIEPAAARAALARRYLAAFGPATEVDLRWWSGWTAARTRAALGEIEAVAVRLESGDDGWVLPYDAEDVREAASTDGDSDHAETVALLPGLDPTAMGWKEREWYVGPHAERVFDRNGNIGPTVWVGGRIVGGWGQRPDGEVVYRLLDDIGRERACRVEDEAARLADWLDDDVVTPRFRTPLERDLSA